MARFSIEVELDWIDEEGSIDEVIKSEIEEKIVSMISGKIATDVKTEQGKKFHDAISAKVDEMVNDTFESLLSLQVVRTDDYGDAKQTFPSVREMIKAKFDSYLTEMVDAKTGGKPSGYDSKKTRFEYIMGKAFGDELDKKMKDLAAKVEKDTAAATTAMFEKMREILEQSVKGQLGDKVAELIKLDEILKLGNGKK